LHLFLQDDDRRNDFVYGVSHAQEQESLDAWRFVVLSDPRIQEQLRRSYDQLKQPPVETDVMKEYSTVDNAPLPKSIEDALRPTRRAIVITEAKKPFRVFDVNRAWEDLCGYSYVECKGKTLGSLLRGPETDQLAATSLIAKLLQGEEAGTTLVNYTKSGRAFQNRIRVGPLKDESDNVTHFVGVLQEVKM
jgi:PAS domain S-box-containing protein